MTTTFGLYQETCPQFAHKLESILTAPRLETEHPLNTQILKYLNDGASYGILFGFCIFDPFTSPPTKIADSTPLMTDGDWVWPEYITHFIAEYHLTVPESFISNMERNGWKIPEIPERVRSPDSTNNTIQVAPSEKQATFEFHIPPEPLQELASMLQPCRSLQAVYEICSDNFSMIQTILQLDSLNEVEIFELNDLLSRAILPPKFGEDNQSLLKKEEIVNSPQWTLALLNSERNKLSLSWDTKEVIWLEEQDSEWRLIRETWQQAFARGYNKGVQESNQLRREWKKKRD